MQMRSGLVLCALALSLGCSARGGGGTTVIQDDAGPSDTGSTSPTDTGSTSNPTDTGTPPMECPAPRVRCGAACVDVRTDMGNCGGCGLACTGGMVCQGAQCVTTGPTCNAPRTRCGEACVDTTSSTDHCGGCDRACTPGQRCASGSCQAPPSCTPPQVFCGAGCANTNTDPRHCGVCGLACASDERCTNGVCVRGTPPTDAGTPTGNTRAGGPCRGDEDCGDGELGCLRFLSGQGFCTNTCEQGTLTGERNACGGTGGTCVSGVPLTAMGGMRLPGACTRSCVPTATTVSSGACPAGQVCTGFWYNNTGGMPDNPGCWPHCTTNAHCTGAQDAMGTPLPSCNVRTGQCSPAPSNPALRADGSPCNPQEVQTTMIPQCRGICFSLSSMRPTQGLCGSFLNTAQTSSCPDTPSTVQPRAAPGDNYALCIFRECTSSSQCGAGTICIYPEDGTGTPVTTAPRVCLYPSAAQPRGV